MARVRAETSELYESLDQGGWCHPADPNGRFWLMPSEVIIQLMKYARGEPFLLPWNASDTDEKLRSRWNHMLQIKKWKELVEPKKIAPHKTIEELYSAQFWWKGAPTTLTQKPASRGKAGGIKKITADAKAAAEEVASPKRDNPVLMAARKRDMAAALLDKSQVVSTTAQESPPPKKAKKSTTAQESPKPPKPTPKKPKAPTRLPNAKPRTTAAVSKKTAPESSSEDDEGDITKPPHRFIVDEEVHIFQKEVLGSCIILDLEPYVNIDKSYGAEKFVYHRVKLVNITKYARDNKFVFQEADFLPGGDRLIHEVNTSVPLEEDDRMLHPYMDGEHGKKNEIIIWDAYLVAKPKVPVEPENPPLVALPTAGPGPSKPKPKSAPAKATKAPPLPRSSAAAPRAAGARKSPRG
jgi:hypothetical protein